MKNNYLKKHLYGIQKKALFSMTAIVSFVFVVTILSIGTVVLQNSYHSITAQYTYVNDKLFLSFQSIYEELDRLTAGYVTNEYVQKSLCNRSLTSNESDMLIRTLSYLNKSYMDYYLWLDNKGNTYAQKEVQLDLNKFNRSVLYKNLGTEYSKTKLFWERDVIFGSNDMALFVGRYVYPMNSIHEPGIIYIKLKQQIFKNIVKELNEKNSIYIILDSKNQVCFEYVPENISWLKNERNNILESIIVKQEEAQKNIHQVKNVKEGTICQIYDNNTGFTIATYVPKSISGKVMKEVLLLLGAIFLGAYSLAIWGIIIFSKKLTEPIKTISKVMMEFDNHKLNERMLIYTNTELDMIGEAYNKMVENVSGLMEDVKMKENQLVKSELNSLLYQLRPHFLYNTLDTIYMFARIQKDEAIMKMIQALSKFLRINLNNGINEIEVAKELEHVSAYLDIQKIRNNNLFDYHIYCEEELKNYIIIKMILQPLAENCIKYGFQDITDGGIINIRISQDTKYLILSVENNGTPIDEQTKKLLNQLQYITLDKVDKVIPKKHGGFGICNVVKRLRLKYDNQIKFYFIKKEQGTDCIIKISKKFL